MCPANTHVRYARATSGHIGSRGEGFTEDQPQNLDLFDCADHFSSKHYRFDEGGWIVCPAPMPPSPSLPIPHLCGQGGGWIGNAVATVEGRHHCRWLTVLFVLAFLPLACQCEASHPQRRALVKSVPVHSTSKSVNPGLQKVALLTGAFGSTVATMGPPSAGQGIEGRATP